MRVLGMSFYRCVVLISWQMSYILFLPIIAPMDPISVHVQVHLAAAVLNPDPQTSPLDTPIHFYYCTFLHLIRCFKNAMPKSALSPPLTSGHSHPPILSHHYTIYGVPTKQHQTTPLPPAMIQP